MKSSIRLDPEPLIERIQSDTSYMESVSRDMIRGWRRVGSIDLYRADALCMKLGIHPVEIWGNEFYRNMEEV